MGVFHYIIISIVYDKPVKAKRCICITMFYLVVLSLVKCYSIDPKTHHCI